MAHVNRDRGRLKDNSILTLAFLQSDETGRSITPVLDWGAIDASRINVRTEVISLDRDDQEKRTDVSVSVRAAQVSSQDNYAIDLILEGDVSPKTTVTLEAGVFWDVPGTRMWGKELGDIGLNTYDASLILGRPYVDYNEQYDDPFSNALLWGYGAWLPENGESLSSAQKDRYLQTTLRETGVSQEVEAQARTELRTLVRGTEGVKGSPLSEDDRRDVERALLSLLSLSNSYHDLPRAYPQAYQIVTSAIRGDTTEPPILFEADPGTAKSKAYNPIRVRLVRDVSGKPYIVLSYSRKYVGLPTPPQGMSALLAAATIGLARNPQLAVSGNPQVSREADQINRLNELWLYRQLTERQGIPSRKSGSLPPVQWSVPSHVVGPNAAVVASIHSGASLTAGGVLPSPWLHGSCLAKSRFLPLSDVRALLETFQQIAAEQGNVKFSPPNQPTQSNSHLDRWLTMIGGQPLPIGSYLDEAVVESYDTFLMRDFSSQEQLKWLNYVGFYVPYHEWTVLGKTKAPAGVASSTLDTAAGVGYLAGDPGDDCRQRTSGDSTITMSREVPVGRWVGALQCR